METSDYGQKGEKQPVDLCAVHLLCSKNSYFLQGKFPGPVLALNHSQS